MLSAFSYRKVDENDPRTEPVFEVPNGMSIPWNERSSTQPALQQWAMLSSQDLTATNGFLFLELLHPYAVFTMSSVASTLRLRARSTGNWCVEFGVSFQFEFDFGLSMGGHDTEGTDFCSPNTQLFVLNFEAGLQARLEGRDG